MRGSGECEQLRVREVKLRGNNKVVVEDEEEGAGECVGGWGRGERWWVDRESSGSCGT